MSRLERKLGDLLRAHERDLRDARDLAALERRQVHGIVVPLVFITLLPLTGVTFLDLPLIVGRVDEPMILASTWQAPPTLRDAASIKDAASIFFVESISDPSAPTRAELDNGREVVDAEVVEVHDVPIRPTRPTAGNESGRMFTHGEFGPDTRCRWCGEVLWVWSSARTGNSVLACDACDGRGESAL